MPEVSRPQNSKSYAWSPALFFEEDASNVLQRARMLNELEKTHPVLSGSLMTCWHGVTQCTALMPEASTCILRRGPCCGSSLVLYVISMVFRLYHVCGVKDQVRRRTQK